MANSWQPAFLPNKQANNNGNGHEFSLKKFSIKYAKRSQSRGGKLGIN